jgi:hypothetical protein
MINKQTHPPSRDGAFKERFDDVTQRPVNGAFSNEKHQKYPVTARGNLSKKSQRRSTEAGRSWRGRGRGRGKYRASTSRHDSQNMDPQPYIPNDTQQYVYNSSGVSTAQAPMLNPPNNPVVWSEVEAPVVQSYLHTIHRRLDAVERDVLLGPPIRLFSPVYGEDLITNIEGMIAGVDFSLRAYFNQTREAIISENIDRLATLRDMVRQVREGKMYEIVEWAPLDDINGHTMEDEISGWSESVRAEFMSRGFPAAFGEQAR